MSEQLFSAIRHNDLPTVKQLCNNKSLLTAEDEVSIKIIFYHENYPKVTFFLKKISLSFALIFTYLFFLLIFIGKENCFNDCCYSW